MIYFSTSRKKAYDTVFSPNLLTNYLIIKVKKIKTAGPGIMRILIVIYEQS